MQREAVFRFHRGEARGKKIVAASELSGLKRMTHDSSYGFHLGHPRE
jgi:hypothetical protein